MFALPLLLHSDNESAGVTSNETLYFTSTYQDSTVQYSGDYNLYIYSEDANGWEQWPMETDVKWNGSEWEIDNKSYGTELHVRKHTDTQTNPTEDHITFSMDGEISAAGNIESVNEVGRQSHYETFSGCESLININGLIFPDTTGDYCYEYMFEGCTGLKDLSNLTLPAKTLSNCCYHEMFKGCTGLELPPVISATTFYGDCCNGMFSGCIKLEETPVLMAEDFEGYQCCMNMFNGCTNLEKVTCHASEISGQKATTSWLNGVAESGVFYTPDISTWDRTASGIPSGWKVNVATVDLGGEYIPSEKKGDWVYDGGVYKKEFNQVGKWAEITDEIENIAEKPECSITGWDPLPDEDDTLFDYVEATAIWSQAETFDIIYKDQGGTDFSGTHESDYPTEHTNGTDTILKGATKSGYDFVGWFTNSECTGDPINKLSKETQYTGDITIYAKWTESPTPPVPPGPEPEPTPVPTPSGDIGIENTVFIAGVGITVVTLFAVAFMISRMRK